MNDYGPMQQTDEPHTHDVEWQKIYRMYDVLLWIYIEAELGRIYMELVHWHKLQKLVKSSMVLEARRLAREGGWVGRGVSKRGPLGHWQCFISPSGWYSLCDNLSTYICNICAFTCIIIHNIKAIKKKSTTNNFRKAVSKRSLSLGLAGRRCPDKILIRRWSQEALLGEWGSGTGQADETCGWFMLRFDRNQRSSVSDYPSIKNK